MRARKRGALGALVGMALASGALSVASTAPAFSLSGYTPNGTCTIYWWSSTSSDYAKTFEASGNCSTIGVRHRYRQVGLNYWTVWKFNGSYAETSSIAELNASDHYQSAS